MKKIMNSKFSLLLTIFVSILFVVIGLLNKNYNLSLVGLLILYVYCILYLFQNLRDNIYILLFYAVIFVFILSRPTINMIRSEVWWYVSYESTTWSIIAIYISLLSLLLANIFTKKKKKKKMDFNSNGFFDGFNIK